MYIHTYMYMCLGTDTQASAIHSCLVTSGSCAGLDKKKASSPLGLTCAFMSVCAQVSDGAGRNDGCKSCVCYFHLSDTCVPARTAYLIHHRRGGGDDVEVKLAL